MSGRRGAGAISSLVNAKDLQLECASLVHETLLVLVLTYGSGGRRRDLELGLYRWIISGFLGVGRMDRVPNAWIRELCEVTKGVDEGVLQWYGHLERMERDRIAKSIYV